MEILIKKLFANISFAMLRILDGIFELFGFLTGVTDVPTTEITQGGSLLNIFLYNDKISTVFVWILIISVALLGLFTIVGIIKSMVTKKNPVNKVLTKFAGAFLAFFVLQIVVLAGITLSDKVLMEVNGAFSQETNVKLSQRIFTIAVEDGGWCEKEDGTYYSHHDFYPTMDAHSVFGEYKKSWGFEQSPGYEEYTNENGETAVRPVEVTVYGNRIADLFKTNIFILFVASLIIFILISICLITLAKRIFEIVFYYLCMPLAVSTIPMDDGAKFKLWGEAIISKVLAVYGTVIAINLYIMFLDIMGDGIKLGTSSWVQTLFNLILMIGGAMAAFGGAALFGRLIGAQQDSGRGLGVMLYTGMTMGGMAAGAARGVTNMIFGKSGGGGGIPGIGGRSGGLLRAAGRTLNTAGKALGGNRYTAIKDNVSGGYARLKAQLSGAFMSNNGVIGMGAKAGSAAIHAGSNAVRAARFTNAMRKMNSLDQTGSGSD